MSDLANETLTILRAEAGAQVDGLLKDSAFLKALADAISEATKTPKWLCYAVLRVVRYWAGQGLSAVPAGVKQGALEAVMGLPGAKIVLAELNERARKAMAEQRAGAALRQALMGGDAAGLTDLDEDVEKYLSTDTQFMLSQTQGLDAARADIQEALEWLRQLDAAVKVEPPIELHFADRQDSFHFGARRWGFFGRQADLDWLESFLWDSEWQGETQRRFTWAFLHGPAGVGKSRLALEFLLQRCGGWRAGFLKPQRAEISEFKRWSPRQPTVMVVDYASLHAEELGLFMDSLAERDAGFDYPVRILLLERYAAASWFEQSMLFGKGGDTQKNRLKARQYPGSPRLLEPLSDDELWSIIAAQLPPDHDDGAWPKEVTLQRFKEHDPQMRPLLAAFIGDALAHDVDPFAGGMAALVSGVLEREKLSWAAKGADDKDRRLLALSTVCQGLPLSALDQLSKDRFPNREEFLQRKERLVGMAGPLRDSTEAGKPDRRLPPVEPDLLGELFALNEFHVHDCPFPDWQHHDLHEAWRIAPSRTREFFSRVMRDFSNHPTTLWMQANPPQGGEDVPIADEHLRALQLVGLEVALASRDEEAELGEQEAAAAVQVGPPRWAEFWPTLLTAIKTRFAVTPKAAAVGYQTELLRFLDAAQKGWSDAALAAAGEAVVAHVAALAKAAAEGGEDALDALFTCAGAYLGALHPVNDRAATERILEALDGVQDAVATTFLGLQIAASENRWTSGQSEGDLGRLERWYRKTLDEAVAEHWYSDTDALALSAQAINLIWCFGDRDVAHRLVEDTLSVVEAKLAGRFAEEHRPGFLAAMRTTLSDAFVGVPLEPSPDAIDLSSVVDDHPVTDAAADHSFWEVSSAPFALWWENRPKQAFTDARVMFAPLCRYEIERVRFAELQYVKPDPATGGFVPERVFDGQLNLIRLGLRDPDTRARAYVNLLATPKGIYGIDGANAPVYQALSDLGANVATPEEAIAWSKVFFAHVYGRHGAFRFFEDPYDLPLTKPLPVSVMRVAREVLSPVRWVRMDGDVFVLRAGILFKNALFRADVRVQPNGQLELTNEELVVENMPVSPDPFRVPMGCIMPLVWPRPPEVDEWAASEPRIVGPEEGRIADQEARGSEPEGAVQVAVPSEVVEALEAFEGGASRADTLSRLAQALNLDALGFACVLTMAADGPIDDGPQEQMAKALRALQVLGVGVDMTGDGTDDATQRAMLLTVTVFNFVQALRRRAASEPYG